MNRCEYYLNELSSHISSLRQELGNINIAAGILADAQNNNRLIHVFGTEPTTSALITEVFFRPGMPMNINPILDPSLDIAHGAYRNAMCQDLDGLAPCILDYYEYVEAGEPILLLGSNPSLPMFAQALRWAKAKGLRTIAVLSGNGDYHCDAEVVLYTHENTVNEQAVLLAALMQLVMSVTVEKLSECETQIWTGLHAVDLAANQNKIDSLLFRIRHL